MPYAAVDCSGLPMQFDGRMSASSAESVQTAIQPSHTRAKNAQTILDPTTSFTGTFCQHCIYMRLATLPKWLIVTQRLQLWFDFDSTRSDSRSIAVKQWNGNWIASNWSRVVVVTTTLIAVLPWLFMSNKHLMISDQISVNVLNSQLADHVTTTHSIPITSTWSIINRTQSLFTHHSSVGQTVWAYV